MAILSDASSGDPNARKKAVSTMLLSQAPVEVKRGMDFVKKHFDPTPDEDGNLTPSQLKKMELAHKAWHKFIDKTVEATKPDKNSGTITSDLAEFLTKFHTFQKMKEVKYDETESEIDRPAKPYQPLPSPDGDEYS